MSPKTAPSLGGDPGPHLIHIWVQPFSTAHGCDQQAETDRQRDTRVHRPGTSVTTGRTGCILGSAERAMRANKGTDIICGTRIGIGAAVVQLTATASNTQYLNCCVTLDTARAQQAVDGVR